jgi:signal transduction histidine kinase
MEVAPTRGAEELPVDATLRRIVVLYRLLGWGWMIMLLMMTPGDDAGANRPVMIAAGVLATAWTAATLWAAGRANQVRTRWFPIVDLAIALVIGAASTVAGAKDLFHGGYPMSTLGVTAYRFGLRGALAASLILGTEQVIVHVVDDKGVVPAAGSITFVVFAILLGWGFDALRGQERRRLAMQAELEDAHDRQIRHEERINLANRLHDSVLQTLIALRRSADDPAQVRYLSRRQERDLRRTISEYRSSHDPSARAAVEAVCDGVEDIYRIEVDAVVRGDALLDAEHQAIVEAAHEALINAAKHAEVDRVDLYAEIAGDRMTVFVRDRGLGFDPDAAGHHGGLGHSIHNRVAAIGGSTAVAASPDGGTEVQIRWASQ